MIDRPWSAPRRSCRCGSSSSPSSPTPRRSTRPSRSCSTSWPCRSPTSTPTATAKAREHGVYIQTGRSWRSIRGGPARVFNTTCLIGPDGLLYKYRKVNPWIPWEVHASPHDSARLRRAAVPGRRDRDRPPRLRDLLRLAVPRGDPPAGAERGRGADPRVGLHGPVGRDAADGLVDGGQPRRALENIAYVVAANQGASLRHYPPFSWPGGSRWSTSTAGSSPRPPGPGEKIVVAPIDISALRHERATRAATTCSRTCGPRPIRSTANRATLPGTCRPLRCRTTRTSRESRKPRNSWKEDCRGGSLLRPRSDRGTVGAELAPPQIRLKIVSAISAFPRECYFR